MSKQQESELDTSLIGAAPLGMGCDGRSFERFKGRCSILRVFMCLPSHDNTVAQPIPLRKHASAKSSNAIAKNVHNLKKAIVMRKVNALMRKINLEISFTHWDR